MALRKRPTANYYFFFYSDSAYINFTSLIHLTKIFERVNKRSKSSSENWPNRHSFAVIENRLAVSVIRKLQTADCRLRTRGKMQTAD